MSDEISTHSAWIPATEMTIYFANQNMASLTEYFASRTFIDIDLSKVCEIDCAGLQLLLFAKREAESQGKPFCVSKLGPIGESVFSLLKFDAQMQTVGGATTSVGFGSK